MRTVEWILGVMLALVALYLVLLNPAAVSQIFSSLGSLGAQTFGTLQGRSVSGGGISVGAFQR